MAGEEVQSLAQQVQQQTQHLWQQLQEQVLRSAQVFYGNSLWSLNGQLGNDRSQLHELLEASIDKAAKQQRGVEEEAGQAVQQA